MMATKQHKVHLNAELKKTVETKEEDGRVDGGRQQPGMVSLWKQVVANAASLTFNLRLLPHALLQLEQFHIKNKCGIRGDDPGVACCSIGHIWCAGDFSPLAQAHLNHRRK